MQKHTKNTNMKTVITQKTAGLQIFSENEFSHEKIFPNFCNPANVLLISEAAILKKQKKITYCKKL